MGRKSKLEKRKKQAKKPRKRAANIVRDAHGRFAKFVQREPDLVAELVAEVQALRAENERLKAATPAIPLEDEPGQAPMTLFDDHARAVRMVQEFFRNRPDIKFAPDVLAARKKLAGELTDSGLKKFEAVAEVSGFTENYAFYLFCSPEDVGIYM